MYINSLTTKPRVVDGRTFIEKTINSKFKKGDVTITTTYMDGKPLIKQYVLSGPDIMKNVWKDLRTKTTRETLLDKNLNVIG